MEFFVWAVGGIGSGGEFGGTEADFGGGVWDGAQSGGVGAALSGGAVDGTGCVSGHAGADGEEDGGGGRAGETGEAAL